MIPFPLKMIRSLVLGETVNNHHLHPHSTPTSTSASTSTMKSNKKNSDHQAKNTPLLLFLPTQELVTHTFRLATIARDIGMDMYPTPSLSHIIFSYPSSPSSSSFSWSSTSLSSASSSSWYLASNDDAVPLPFPSLFPSSLSHLRCFVSLSKGLFKLVFVNTNSNIFHNFSTTIASNWDCCSFSLFWRLTGDRIDSMDAFSRALTGMGWTLFKTHKNPPTVYLFRKVESPKQEHGKSRIRELRLPTLDFQNAPLRILQYLLLMTHDTFYLA